MLTWQPGIFRFKVLCLNHNPERVQTIVCAWCVDYIICRSGLNCYITVEYRTEYNPCGWFPCWSGTSKLFVLVQEWSCVHLAFWVTRSAPCPSLGLGNSSITQNAPAAKIASMGNEMCVFRFLQSCDPGQGDCCTDMGFSQRNERFAHVLGNVGRRGPTCFCLGGVKPHPPLMGDWDWDWGGTGTGASVWFPETESSSSSSC